ncbi:MAG: IS110 family transposase [Chryseolinea sp.]
MFSQRYCLIRFYLFEFEQNVRNSAGRYIQNIQPGDKTKRDFHFDIHLPNLIKMKILKQVLGTDVAEDELVVSLARMLENLRKEVYASHVFPNTTNGFEALIAWVKRVTEPSLCTRFVMEATGVYHEKFAYFLADQDLEVSIVLPNKISNYFKSLEVKTTTDRTASEAIALFGLDRQLDIWHKPKTVFKRLRQLCRERNQLVDERTIVKNQLHAECSEVEPLTNSIKRMEKRIVILVKQEAEVKKEIAEMVSKDKQVSDSVKLITTIPGVSLITAATVLAETNGFELIRNRRQLTSYAGLDVREKQSGTSVKGKPRISKRGNRYLRKCLYMPALCAVRFNRQSKELYTRLVSKHGIKMKASVAVQRKLLELMYTLYKTNTPYDPEHTSHKKEEVALKQ